jgi:hypothetical protein
LQVRQIIKGYFGGDDRDERVRAKLVETLYTQPISLLIGALCGVAACGTAALISGDWMITVGAVLLTLIAVARVRWPTGSPTSRAPAMRACSSGSTKRARSATRCFPA